MNAKNQLAMSLIGAGLADIEGDRRGRDQKLRQARTAIDKMLREPKPTFRLPASLRARRA
jgi:hypothetical protein